MHWKSARRRGSIALFLPRHLRAVANMTDRMIKDLGAQGRRAAKSITVGFLEARNSAMLRRLTRKNKAYSAERK